MHTLAIWLLLGFPYVALGGGGGDGVTGHQGDLQRRVADLAILALRAALADQTDTITGWTLQYSDSILTSSELADRLVKMVKPVTCQAVTGGRTPRVICGEGQGGLVPSAAIDRLISRLLQEHAGQPEPRILLKAPKEGIVVPASELRALAGEYVIRGCVFSWGREDDAKQTPPDAAYTINLWPSTRTRASADIHTSPP